MLETVSADGPTTERRKQARRAAREAAREAIGSGPAATALEVPAVLTGHGPPWLEGSRPAADSARLAGVA